MEVENALANERIFTQPLLEKIADDNQRAYKLASKQYEVGHIEVLDVLQIQGRVLAAAIASLYTDPIFKQNSQRQRMKC